MGRREVQARPDSRGRGALSGPAAVEARLVIRPEEAVIDPGASVFRLSAGQISRRIKAATKMAGLGDGFSAHSPRTADGVISSGVRTVELAVRTTGLLNAGRKHRPIVFA